VLISGTGSIAIGRDSSGREHRCGGWGWLVDGGGSAMDIGHDGLALSLRMADGRVPETGLKQALWQALEVQHPHELKALVVDPHFGAAGFARLAPVVSAQAAAGDGPAQQVIAHAGRQLADLVAGVARNLELTAPPICCSGGAISHLEPLQKQFKQQLTLLLPKVKLVSARGDACSGALALAQALSS
ncbi:MAG: BadF/BadG/BcrA/BcrD ATPase family protein, partial [Synechococcus sp.]|nr:BadF/BadG/BcrA/BcrD ATPase family protein [Synechococcus sp.]